MPKSSKSKPKARPYAGDLAEPIYETILWASISSGLDERKRLAEQRARRRQVAKLKLLFDWYEINAAADDQWQRLALALAEAHVEGMRVIYDQKPKRGRKPKWKEGLSVQLSQEVNQILLTRKKMPISEAIEDLTKDPASSFYKSHPPSLNVRYREASREDKRHRRFVEKVKLRTIPTSVNLGSPSGSPFPIVKWKPLPSKIPLKRFPTQ
jgi:hypothetical protein